MTNEIENKLYQTIKQVLEQARNTAYRAVNSAMVFSYWEIGRLIVKDEQKGEQRAPYGKGVLKELSQKLIRDFGKGFDERELRRMRQFFLCFSIRDALRPELTWTHYRSLIRIENKSARDYYLNESVAANWSSRALDRQINTLYFERLLSSKEKEPVKNEMQEKTKELTVKPQDFIKDPYILEFLNLPTNFAHKEKDIENNLVLHLQQFLLELGNGFAFVAQQKHIRTESSDFFIDLVFYHIKLKCYVLIDFKLGKLVHQDIGQMDMYVRMFNDLEKSDSDNPTIGIILCSSKDETVVKYSVLAENKNLFASEYMTYLPTEEQLKELIEADRFMIEQQLQ